MRSDVTVASAQHRYYRSTLWIPLLLAGLLAMGGVCMAQTVQSPDFTIVALPDTQMYSQDFPANFTSQTQWIANNQSGLNIKFVVGLGDIVNVGNSTTQWNNAMASIGVMDTAGVPYALAIGNHDYNNSDAFLRTDTYSDSSFYNQYVGISHYQGRSYYGGSTYPPGENDNFYAVMTINGDTYLFLMIEYWPRDGAITWAQSVLAAYPNAKVIVVSHGYLGTDGFRTGPHNCGGPGSWGGDNNGEDMWSKLISQYPNIIMVLNGHLPNPPQGHEFVQGMNGTLINEIMADYQDDPNGGNGYLRILTFHPTLHTLDVQTYSPTLSMYLNDSENQFTVPLDTQGLNLNQVGLRGYVRGISTGCSTNAVNGIVSYALGANAPAYSVPDASGYYATPSNLLPGTYTMKANAPGYAPLVSSQPVVAGYILPARFYLTATTDEFTLTSTPASQTVVAGSGTSFSTTLSSAGTYASASVTLSAIGLPAGASATFSPSTLTGSGTSTLTLSTTSNVAPGTYAFLISGISGDMQRISPATLIIQPQPDFSVSPSPSSVNVAQGSQSTSTVTSDIVGAFNAAVTLSASGLPSGVTATFSVNPLAAPGSGSSVVTFSATSGATLGSGTVTITATGGGITHTTTINLTVVQPPDFSIASDKQTIAVLIGGSTTATISTAITGLFNSAISLSSSGLPTKVTAAFSPSSIGAPGAGSSTLTLSAASQAHVGTSTITITGSGGGKTHGTNITLNVVSTPSVASVSFNPASVPAGTSSTGTVTLNAVAPSGGAVVSLSSGNTAAVQVPSSVTVAAGATSANFTATTSANVSAGAVVTVTATWNSVAASNLTVVSKPSISKSFGAGSIPVNGTTTLSFTIQNNNTATTLTGVGFADTFPSGLVVSNPNGLSGSCGGGTITATAGTGSVSLTGGSLTASSSCTFSVNVTGNGAGTLNNVTGNVTSTEGGTGGTASATLVVGAVKKRRGQVISN